LGHVRGRTQIIRFGVAPGDRLDNEVTEWVSPPSVERSS